MNNYRKIFYPFSVCVYAPVIFGLYSSFCFIPFQAHLISNAQLLSNSLVQNCNPKEGGPNAETRVICNSAARMEFAALFTLLTAIPTILLFHTILLTPEISALWDCIYMLSMAAADNNRVR